MTTHAVAHDACPLGVDRQSAFRQLRQFLRNVIQHVVVLLVLLRRSVQVEARADAEVISMRLLVRDTLAPGRSVGDDEHQAQGIGSLEGEGLLGKVLVRASEAAEPVDHWQLLPHLRALGNVGCKLHGAPSQHRTRMLEALEIAATATHRRDLLDLRIFCRAILPLRLRLWLRLQLLGLNVRGRHPHLVDVANPSDLDRGLRSVLRLGDRDDLGGVELPICELGVQFEALLQAVERNGLGHLCLLGRLGLGCGLLRQLLRPQVLHP
mmetsp:Transcript_125434/g.267792  ORF Transcript_125434/g.267792 Transcript_125434/m.267792 type:complete len:266 (-) Transcript_125434:227-1024(-)